MTPAGSRCFTSTRIAFPGRRILRRLASPSCWSKAAWSPSNGRSALPICYLPITSLSRSNRPERRAGALRSRFRARNRRKSGILPSRHPLCLHGSGVSQGTIMKRWLAAVVLVMALLTSDAGAEVRDAGNFFSPDAVQKANAAMQQMQRDLGKEMLVETYPAIPAERASEYRPENKDDFFRKWGNERATAAHVSGVYILINRTPSYLFITAGNKTRERDFTTT